VLVPILCVAPARGQALERPDSVHVVHPKTGEEAWWPLFDAAGRPLFPELMAELDAIKESAIAGHIFRRDHKHRRGAISLPWITARGDLDHLRSTVKKIVRAAKIRDELSFSSFRHGGFMGSKCTLCSLPACRSIVGSAAQSLTARLAVDSTRSRMTQLV
jgi:hypothetical protein